MISTKLPEWTRVNLRHIIEEAKTLTSKNTSIPPDFMVLKFCGKAQFLHSFGRITRNYAETVLFQNSDTRKSGEIVVLFKMLLFTTSRCNTIYFLNISVMWEASWCCYISSWNNICEDITVLFSCTHFMSLVSFNNPWNIRKPEAFWCFEEVSKENSLMKFYEMG